MQTKKRQTGKESEKEEKKRERWGGRIFNLETGERGRRVRTSAQIIHIHISIADGASTQLVVQRHHQQFSYTGWGTQDGGHRVGDTGWVTHTID